MKKSILTLAAIALGTAAFAADQAPAFPGAEGRGRYVTGGRGGKVLHVTTLEDNEKEGSLRWALKQSGKRIIVFDVSGTIELKSTLTFSNGDVTILGQTAPGEGITLAYYTLEPKASNVIIRFLRSRRSQVKDVNDGADAFFERQRANIIIDHCSFSWSIDEVASFYDNTNTTFQWSTVAEGLCNAGHGKGAHSYGGIWGGKGASFHHNMIAHVQNRAPRFNGARYQWTGVYGGEKYENITTWLKNGKTGLNTVVAEQVDFRNTIIYNWGNGNGCYGGPGGGYINIVNNYYKAGPGTSAKTRVTQVTVGASGNSTPEQLYGYASRYYINGNYVTAAKDPENYDWEGVTYDSGLYLIDGERWMADKEHIYGEDQVYKKNVSGVDCISVKVDQPVNAGEVTTHTAQEAYEKVLQYVGASLYRDAVDARYVEECRTGTTTYKVSSNPAGILDKINDPNGTQDSKTASFPKLKEEKRPADYDTDGDGIPDAWEIANGLNPNDITDGSAYTLDPRGWYTNIEVYANSLVEHIMKGGNADAISAVEEYYPAFNHPAGIEDVTVSKGEVEKIEYYTLEGIKVAEPVEGINIRVITYSNGAVESDKVLKK